MLLLHGGDVVGGVNGNDAVYYHIVAASRTGFPNGKADMSSNPINDDDALVIAAARHLAARYNGDHRVILEPGSARAFRRPAKDAGADQTGVQVEVTIIDGGAKDERLTFDLALEGAPARVVTRNALMIAALADDTGANGSTHAELINSAARKLFPTAKHPTPRAVAATIGARVVAGYSRPFLELLALKVAR